MILALSIQPANIIAEQIQSDTPSSVMPLKNVMTWIFRNAESLKNPKILYLNLANPILLLHGNSFRHGNDS